MGEVNKTVSVVLHTSRGDIVIALFTQSAPKACENFIGLARKGYYNGIIFHRVIKGFMIQGGDPTGTGRGGESVWARDFEDEFSPELKFSRPGILAMANRGPHTNGSQFFITTAPTHWLNNKHTIFGEVTEGYDIVEQIENTRTTSGDKPVDPQTILRVTIK
jgi:peptidylprolyl isomerase